MYSASFASASDVDALSVFAFSIFSVHSDFALSFSVMLSAFFDRLFWLAAIRSS